MRLNKLIFALCLLLTFSVVKVEAYTDAKTGQAQLNMNKLLSSTMMKHDHRWCRREGWNTVCYDNNLYEDCTLFCNNNNNYTYNFDYEIKKNHSEEWKALDKNDVFKCDTVRSKFGVIGDWGATLEKKCAKVWKNIKVYSACWSHSPPTDILECDDKEDCLYKAKGYTLTPEYDGKGVQQVPANFVSGVEKSLVSDNDATKCVDGVCPITKEGKYNLTMKAPETNYYGQCKGYGMTLEPDGTKIPEMTGNLGLDIVNRAPTTTVSFASTSLSLNKEVDVYCDAFDPDDCVDKISKVTLSCQDSTGDTSGCAIYDPLVGSLGSSLVREISSDNQTNPFRLAAKLKIVKPGSYMVICNATDNNGTSSTYPDGSDDGSGVGVGGVTVKDDGTSATDGTGPGGGVVDAAMSFCSFIADKGVNTSVCASDGSGKEVKLSLGALYNIKGDGAEYIWDCDGGKDGGSSDSGKKQTCIYDEVGTFNPSLEIKSDGKTTVCKSPGKIKVANQKSCSVEVKKAGPADDFSNEISIQAGEKVEARIKQDCVGNIKIDPNLKIRWSGVSGGEKDEFVIGQLNIAGEKSIGAKMIKTETEYIKDEKGDPVLNENGEKKTKTREEITNCEGAKVNVRDDSSWGAN